MNNSAPWWLAGACAAVVAGAAWRARSLSTGGAVAALCVGTLALHAQWSWGAFLVLWFVLSSALSHMGRDRKFARTHDIVDKHQQRDAIQVLANGAAFALCAAFAATPGANLEVLAVAAAGALTAAGADTWSTEVGTLARGAPWSLREWRRVGPGSSGAVSLLGSLGGIVGAGLLATLAAAVGMLPMRTVPAVAVAGIVGALADTLAGAWLQERRICPACSQITERVQHCRGQHTTIHGGVRYVNNDVVNLLCSILGAIAAPLGVALLR